MSTDDRTDPAPRSPTPGRTLAALARADARRFARHPLFLLGVGAWVVIVRVLVATKRS